jgi:hypothetical protein
MNLQGRFSYNLIQLICVLVLLLFSFTAKSQLRLEGNIHVYGAGQFYFNTFAQYNEANTVGGKTFTQQTILKINIRNDSAIYWKVRAYALDNSFISESSSISLAAFELNITVVSSSKTSVSSLLTPFYILSDPLDPSTILITGTGDGSKDPAEVTLSILYTLKGDFMVLPAEVYFNQLQFELYTHTSSW